MLTNLWKGKTDSTLVQFLRSTCVGVIATAVDVAILVVLTEWFGVHYLQSAAVGFTVGVSVNYLLSVCWVFEKRTFENRATEFALFGVLGLIGLGLNQSLI